MTTGMQQHDPGRQLDLTNSIAKGRTRMRMRTIKQAYEAMVDADPGCCLTMTALRRKVVSGEIPSVKVGTKYLIDIDRLEEFLSPTVSNPCDMDGSSAI